MSSFDRKLGRMTLNNYATKDELEDDIAYLKEMREVVIEGAKQYSDLEKINDFRMLYYKNANEAYEDKLHKIDTAIMRLEMKRSLIPEEIS